MGFVGVPYLPFQLHIKDSPSLAGEHKVLTIELTRTYNGVERQQTALMKVKCKDCGREFSDQPSECPTEFYVYKDEVMCENCLTAKGVLPDHAVSITDLGCQGVCDVPCGLPYCTL